MPQQVSVCIIKIEVVSQSEENIEVGAVSSEHPTNPRVLKERERERGLRNASQIVIETYSNQDEQEDTKTDMNTPRESFSHSREVTPLEEGQCATELPKEIGFFSGNPSVEVTHGIIHLYKKNERKEIKEAPSNKLCLLAVPASISCHDLIHYFSPCHQQIQHIRVVRDGSPNQFMVLLEFRTFEGAWEFYKCFNGVPYSSMEPDSLCHAVWVADVERTIDGSVPPGHTELPTCAVCLERMDESVDGVLTILCNHAFHTNCLIKWGDSTCPVCRHVQTPELMENSVCMECEGTEALWICLICGHVGCGRYHGGHAAAHYRATNHTFALQLGTSSVWDYAGDNFVHRLMQNKTDGKLVASPNDEGEEKLDSMQLEFTYLLTSQLDTQRKYYEQRMDRMEVEWKAFKQDAAVSQTKISELEQKVQALSKEKQTLERKLAQNATKLKEVQKKLTDENQISKALQSNQGSWQNKYTALEQKFQEYQKARETELADLKEQLRDVMFYMSAQNKIADSDLQEELQSGTIVVPEAEESTSSKKASRRNKKQ